MMCCVDNRCALCAHAWSAMRQYKLGHSEKGGGGNDLCTARVDGGVISGVSKAGRIHVQREKRLG
jgi:hypothetical protein